MPTYIDSTDYDQFNQNNRAGFGYDLEEEKKRIAEGTAEIKKELLEKWQKRYANAQIFPDALQGMHPELLQYLLSFEHTLFYNDLAEKFSLSQEQRDILPHIVWHLCQTKNWEDLNGLLQKNTSLSESICNQITQIISSQILTKARELSLKETPSGTSSRSQASNQPALARLPFSQAMEEIPEIGEQNITADHINVLNFPEPVRPSLKNWLSDYTSYFGYERHNSIEIGNYLFHSQNAQRLTSSDRQRLSYVLKAFNHEMPITVNKTTKQIVFPTMQPMSQSAVTNNRPLVIEKQTLGISNQASIIDNQTSNVGNQSSVISNRQLANQRQSAISNQQSSNVSNRSSELDQDTKSQPQNAGYRLEDTEGLTFSSPQKLPYENEVEKTTATTPARTNSIPPKNLPLRNFQRPTSNQNTIVLEKKPDPPRPSGKNVVNLREV